MKNQTNWISYEDMLKREILKQLQNPNLTTEEKNKLLEKLEALK